MPRHPVEPVDAQAPTQRPLPPPGHSQPGLHVQHFPGPTWFSREPSVAAVLAPEQLLPPGTGWDAVAQAGQRLGQAFAGWLQGLPPLALLAPAHAQALIAACWGRGLLNAVRGCVEDAGATPHAGSRLLLWVGCHDPTIGRDALQLGLAHARQALQGPWRDDPALAQARQQVLQRCRQAHPDAVSRVLILAARQLGVPVQPMRTAPAGGQAGPVMRSIQYGWGCRAMDFFEASPLREPAAALSLVRDKAHTVARLAQLGYPVPRQHRVGTAEQALAAAQALGWPVVVKPADRGKGLGVTAHITDEAQLRQALATAQPHSSQPLLVEEHLPGDDHRLLVVRGRLVAASRREPPTVIGDGVRTVGQLAARLNATRAAQPVLARYLKPVVRQPQIDDWLARQQLAWEAVPAAGQRVRLRSNANVSTGGTPTDVLAQVHPRVRRMAEQIALNIGLEAAGIDYLCTRIDQPPEATGGAVIEVNATPGLDLHLADGSHSEEALGAKLLGPDVGAIPVAVVVDNDTAALAALAEAMRHQDDLAGLGVVHATGAWLAGDPLPMPQASVGERAMRLLGNRCTQALLVLVGCAEVARHGYPVPHSQLALWRNANSGPGSVQAWDTVRRCARELLVAEGHAPAFWQAAPWLERLRAALAPQAGRDGAAPRAAPAAWRPPPLRRDAGLAPVNPGRDRGGLALVALMRNERLALPHFLAHYRALDVAHFHIVDDHSDDGSFEQLLAEPDCTVWRHGAGFRELMANGMAMLYQARNQVAQHAAEAGVRGQRWLLVVDADELAHIPQPFEGLSGPAGLLAAMERDGLVQALAAMVDFYPQRLRDIQAMPADAPPFVHSPWFDREPCFARAADGRLHKRPEAGIRGRLQRLLLQRHPEQHRAIYEGQQYQGPALWKPALLRTGHGIHFRNAHQTTAAPPAGLQLALAHFKFGPGLPARVHEEMQRKAYYLAGIEYRLMGAALALLADEDLVCEASLRFDGPASLQAAGLMYAHGLTGAPRPGPCA